MHFRFIFRLDIPAPRAVEHSLDLSRHRFLCRQGIRSDKLAECRHTLRAKITRAISCTIRKVFRARASIFCHGKLPCLK